MQNRIASIISSIPLPTSHITAVNFEGSSVRVVNSRGRNIVSWATLPVPPGLVRGGLVNDTNALAAIVRTAQGNEKPGKVIAALPGLNTVARAVFVPQGRGVNIKEVVLREARHLLAARLEENYVYWAPLGRQATQQRVLAVVVPRVMTAQYAEVLYQANLKPAQLDLKPFALARVANTTQGIIVNLEESGVDFIILHDGFLTAYRSISLGGENLSPDILFPRLMNELTRYLSFYNTTNPGNPLKPESPLYICGSNALSPELYQSLSQATAHPLAQLKPPLSLPRDFPSEPLAVNLGLLLRGF